MNGSMMDLLLAREIIADTERLSRRAYLYAELPRREEASLMGRIRSALQRVLRRSGRAGLAPDMSALPSTPTVTAGR